MSSTLHTPPINLPDGVKDGLQSRAYQTPVPGFCGPYCAPTNAAPATEPMASSAAVEGFMRLGPLGDAGHQKTSPNSRLAQSREPTAGAARVRRARGSPSGMQGKLHNEQTSVGSPCE